MYLIKEDHARVSFLRQQLLRHNEHGRSGREMASWMNYEEDEEELKKSP